MTKKELLARWINTHPSLPLQGPHQHFRRWLGRLTLRRKVTPNSSPRRRRIVMVAHNTYPNGEPRLRRQAATLSSSWDVDILCLNDGTQPKQECLDGMRVLRLPVGRDRTRSVLAYLGEYVAFALLASVWLTVLHLRHAYDVVHLYNYPDFLVFAALIPKCLGARIILDMRDLMPEFYAVRTGLALHHPALRLLRQIERWSARFAHHVSIAGEPFRRRLIENGIPAGKVTSIMNSAQPSLFYPRSAAAAASVDRSFALTYHGILSEYTDIEVVCEALTLIRNRAPRLQFHVYGYGRTLPALQARIRQLRVEDCVKLKGVLPQSEIAEVIARADLGIASQAQSVFTQMNYPVKAFEYIASDVPVIMSRSPALLELFGDDDCFFFDPQKPDQIAQRILAFYQDPQLGQFVRARQAAAYRRIQWANEAQRFVAMIDQVTDRHADRQNPAVANWQ
jgi:glycosyltransferase involved in cell wall biosynthesis